MIGDNIDWPALGVFLFFFVLVSVMGFVAARWRRPTTLAHIDEWGLGGRTFGTWITWFLVGGDFYTAYTVIAVPALVYSVGAFGFFALPYTIVVYPIVFFVMSRLWTVAAAAGHVTAADVVHARYGSRPLELAVAVTGVLATMPYIALQLIGMEVVIKALGLVGEVPLAIAFLILAFYTYSAGLRAPALIAFVKDIMIYIVVLVAVAVIPLKLGGYGAVFAAADTAFKAKGAGGITLAPAQYLPYATLALGSAMAAFMYPHTLTGHFRVQECRHHPQERRSAAGLHAVARPDRAAGLHGLRRRGEARHAERGGADLVQGTLPRLVRRLRLRGHRDRRLGSGRGHVHRRGEPVHPQLLEGLRQPGDHSQPGRLRWRRSCPWWSSWVP